MQNKPILVIGDSCIDRFVYCHCERLCPDATVPVLDILYRKDSAGMAGNVHRNIEALEYPVILKCNLNSTEIVKARYVDRKSNHMFLRIDDTFQPEHCDDLQEIDFDSYSAIVISDYDKGFLSCQDINYIGSRHPLTFLDTKKILGDWAKTMTFIKINRKEYRLSFPYLDQDLENKIICTLGADGCSYRQVIYRVNEVEIKNLSGAGDSFLAALAVKYLESNGDIAQSLIFANNIATIVVQKKGISTLKDDLC